MPHFSPATRRDFQPPFTPEAYRVEIGGKWYRQYTLFKGFIVYNLLDIEPALAELVKAHEGRNEIGQAEAFAAFVDGLDLTIKVGRPSYRHLADTIQMPPKEAFESLQHWVGTIMHEIGHYTGHQTRMAREAVVNFSGFGSDPYAEEEAVAEWFSLLACNQFGLVRDGVENEAVYIKSWTMRFQNDPDLLTRTFRAAEKAFEWALEKSGVQIGVDADEAREAEAVPACG